LIAIVYKVGRASLRASPVLKVAAKSEGRAEGVVNEDSREVVVGSEGEGSMVTVEVIDSRIVSIE